MIVAGVVIETAPGAAARVAGRLLGAPGLELLGGDGRARIAGLFTGADGAALEALVQGLLAGDEEVLGVFPTYVAAEPSSGGGEAG